MVDTFSDIQVKTNPNKTFVGKGSVLVAGSVRINFSVVNAAKGLFVSWPSQKYTDKEGKDKYQAQVFFPDQATKTELDNRILAEFKNLGGASSKASQSDGIPW